MTSHTLAKVGLIISREFRERTRKKLFIIPTILLAVLALLGMFVPTAMQIFTRGEGQTKMAVLNNAGPVAGQDTAGLLAYLDRSLNASGAAVTGGTASGVLKPPFIVMPAEATDAAAL